MEPFKGKVEIDKTQKHLMNTKHKFRQNLEDFEIGEVFDLTLDRGRSLNGHKKRSTTRSHNRQYSSDSDAGDAQKSVNFAHTDKAGSSSSKNLASLGNSPREERRLDLKSRGRDGGGGGNTRGRSQRRMRTRSSK